MAKGRKRKAGKRKDDTVARFLRPTEAREAHNDFTSAGVAYRVVPMIETLLRAEVISQSEHDALEYYRDQQARAQDDAAQSSTLDAERIMGGGGGGFGSRIPVNILTTPAMVTTSRIERDLGSLLDIAEAIAVRDWSLSRWCIEQHGGRERYDGEGRFLAVVPVAEKRVLDLARQKLRMAAHRIVR